MIYNFTILNNKGVRKQFYMTADSAKDLIKRAVETYAVTPDSIAIDGYYKESGQEDYDHTYITYSEKDQMSKKEQKRMDKATDLFNNAKKKRASKKAEYMKKYGMRSVAVTSAEDIAKLLSQYKKVKCYWETGSKRGEHKYYVLVK